MLHETYWSYHQPTEAFENAPLSSFDVNNHFKTGSRETSSFVSPSPLMLNIVDAEGETKLTVSLGASH